MSAVLFLNRIDRAPTTQPETVIFASAKRKRSLRRIDLTTETITHTHIPVPVRVFEEDVA